MKTCVLDGGKSLAHVHYVERARPEAGPGQVVLRMRAASLNYRDLEVVEGSYFVPVEAPVVPVSDGVGEVVEVGPGVRRVAVGDRVAATFWGAWIDGDRAQADHATTLGGPLDGLLSEYVAPPEQRLVHVPAHLSDVEAASLPCAGVTAWQALVHDGQLAAGQSVLIQGTGGVAVFALQIARMFGAHAIVVGSDSARLERARELGAHATILRSDAEPNWHAAVRALSDGRGVDHVIDTSGPGSFSQSLKAVRAGGTVHLIGYRAGAAGTINPLEMLASSALVRPACVGSRAAFEALNRALSTTRTRPVVDRVFAWTELTSALEFLRTGRQFGKIALQF